MIKTCNLVIALLTLVIAFSSCKNDISKQSPKEIAIQKIIGSQAKIFLQDSMLTAVSIGLYVDGEKITKHYGELDEGKNNTPSDHTLYEIASVTKTFTGALVAQAVLDHKLTLEDGVRDYLEGDYSNLEFEGEPVRIKHLLLHQAGFPQFLPETVGDLMTAFTPDLPMKIRAIQSKYTVAEFLEDVKEIELSAVPGTNYGYSNVDVELMAHILETVYEMPYEELVKKYITNPAGMPNTKIHLTNEEKTNLANGYGMERISVPHFSNSLSGADGGLKSTSVDLVNYMEFLLKDDNPLITESKKVLLDLEDYGAGYFWPIRITEEDGTYYNHHGGAFGTQNWLYIYPKYNLGISVITNQSDLHTAGKLQNLQENLFLSVKEIVQNSSQQTEL